MSKQQQFCQVFHKFTKRKSGFFLTFCSSILQFSVAFFGKKLRFKCQNKSNFTKFFTLSPSQKMVFSNFLLVTFLRFSVGFCGGIRLKSGFKIRFSSAVLRRYFAEPPCSRSFCRPQHQQDVAAKLAGTLCSANFLFP